MGVEASCGWPLFKEKCFIFHILPYKLLISASPIEHFEWPLFKFWLKANCAVHIIIVSHPKC